MSENNYRKTLQKQLEKPEGISGKISQFLDDTDKNLQYAIAKLRKFLGQGYQLPSVASPKEYYSLGSFRTLPLNIKPSTDVSNQTIEIEAPIVSASSQKLISLPSSTNPEPKPVPTIAPAPQTSKLLIPKFETDLSSTTLSTDEDSQLLIDDNVTTLTANLEILKKQELDYNSKIDTNASEYERIVDEIKVLLENKKNKETELSNLAVFGPDDLVKIVASSAVDKFFYGGSKERIQNLVLSKEKLVDLHSDLKTVFDQTRDNYKDIIVRSDGLKSILEGQKSQIAALKSEISGTEKNKVLTTIEDLEREHPFSFSILVLTEDQLELIEQQRTNYITLLIETGFTKQECGRKINQFDIDLQGSISDFIPEKAKLTDEEYNKILNAGGLESLALQTNINEKKEALKYVKTWKAKLENTKSDSRVLQAEIDFLENEVEIQTREYVDADVYYISLENIDLSPRKITADGQKKTREKAGLEVDTIFLDLKNTKLKLSEKLVEKARNETALADLELSISEKVEELGKVLNLLKEKKELESKQKNRISSFARNSGLDTNNAKELRAYLDKTEHEIKAWDGFKNKIIIDINGAKEDLVEKRKQHDELINTRYYSHLEADGLLERINYLEKQILGFEESITENKPNYTLEEISEYRNKLDSEILGLEPKPDLKKINNTILLYAGNKIKEATKIKTSVSEAESRKKVLLLNEIKSLKTHSFQIRDSISALTIAGGKLVESAKQKNSSLIDAFEVKSEAQQKERANLKYEISALSIKFNINFKTCLQLQAAALVLGRQFDTNNFEILQLETEITSKSANQDDNFEDIGTLISECGIQASLMELSESKPSKDKPFFERVITDYSKLLLGLEKLKKGEEYILRKDEMNLSEHILSTVIGFKIAEFTEFGVSNTEDTIYILTKIDKVMAYLVENYDVVLNGNSVTFSPKGI